MTNISKLTSASLLIVGAMLAAQAHAANWLMAQGTEKPDTTHKFWGFAQPAYTSDRGDALSGLTGGGAANNGKIIGNNLIAPKLEDQEGFHFRRARVGARGNFTGSMRNDFTAKMNYFTLFELADNGLTYDPLGDRARLIAPTDLSLTFNHIKGARIRAGLFKNPINEESLQAIHVFDYIEFTDFTAREILERFTDGAQQPNGSPLAPTLGTPNNKGYGFNGVRDWGVQVFDRFKKDKWDLSYAVKVGRGEGIHESSDTDDNKELYLYGSAEYDLPGGKGIRKHGVKLYAWRQQGKREFSTDPSGREFDRVRQGIGFKALGNLFGSSYKHRVSAELNYADGMIFVAPAGNVPGGNLMYAAEKGNKARGLTLDYGFYLNPKWQFDVRWDRNNLLYDTSANVNVGNEREITATTVGVNYYFNPKLRLTFNYIMREAEAPVDYVASGGFTAGQAAVTTSNSRKVVSTLGDRAALQLTWIF